MPTKRKRKISEDSKSIECTRTEAVSLKNAEDTEDALDRFTVCWKAPASPLGLIEEELYTDPWKLFIGCILLNKTSAIQVHPKIYIPQTKEIRFDVSFGNFSRNGRMRCLLWKPRKMNFLICSSL